MKKIISMFLLGMLFLSGSYADSCTKKDTTETQKIMMSANYSMVIIAPEIFSESLQPLIAHKNSHGVKTFLKTTEEIYNTYKGRDSAEQVKYFIKDAIERFNISYVLLVGGRTGQGFHWYVPVRYVTVNDGVVHKQYLSDLYFADIYKENGDFEDWDSNGNGVFAEWSVNASVPGDVLDLRPDIAVGRLPCRCTDEVTAIVHKIIEYENSSYGQSWFKHILLIGGDTNPGYGDPFPYEGEVDCDYALSYLDGFTATKLYISDGTLTGLEDFLTAFNVGNGFVYYAGHGWPDKMGTYPLNGTEVTYFMDNKDVSSLTNTGMYPVMVVGCCLTTQFDVGILNFLRVLKNTRTYNNFFNFIYECIPECISWNMVKKSHGGCIAYLGSSSTTWGEVGDKNKDDIPDGVQTGYTPGLCQEFFRLYGEKNVRIIGSLFKDAVTHVVKEFSADKNKIQCKCVSEYMLIGDPSLLIGGYPSS
jgi:Peptidase family C25